VQLSWDGGNTWTTAKSTPTLGTAMRTFLLGSATDTWGRSWATGNVSDQNFRVRVINELELARFLARLDCGARALPETSVSNLVMARDFWC